MGSHPAGSNAALPGQPDLFRLSRARLQVPFALGEGDILGMRLGKEKPLCRAPSSFTPLSATQSQHLLRPRPLLSLRVLAVPSSQLHSYAPARPLPSSRTSSPAPPPPPPAQLPLTPSRAPLSSAPPPQSLFLPFPPPPPPAVAGIPSPA